MVEGFGRSWGVNNFCAECDSISLLKRTRARKNLADAARKKRKGNQGSVATGVSIQRGSGTNQEKCRYRLQSPGDAPSLPRMKMAIGRISRRV